MNWNDATRLTAGATESRPRPVARDFWTSLEAEAARWSRRIEDVAASVRQELENVLLPLPPRQLATGALHTRGTVIRARGPQLAGEVRDGVNAGPRRLAIHLAEGPKLQGGRVTLVAAVDRALAGRVARVVLIAGGYEVTLAETRVEADASGGLIRIDCPLGDLGLGTADGGLPASLFRVVIGQEPGVGASAEARGE